MDYKLYTTVDITRTGQNRSEPGKEELRWKEQNFQSVLQTLGLRANIQYDRGPEVTEVRGSVVGFKTDKIIRVWRFDFSTERDFLYENEGDPVGYLKDDFEMVPFISGLDECMQQNFDIFVTYGDSPNIVFSQK
jgi:hypothetical protein